MNKALIVVQRSGPDQESNQSFRDRVGLDMDYFGDSYRIGNLFRASMCRQHMEVPRLGVECELQLPAYTTATAIPDPSRVCDIHHSSRSKPDP